MSEALKRTIKSAEDLQGVVKTMKALAAVNIRQYQRAVESLSVYNQTVSMGLQALLKKRSADSVIFKKAPPKRIAAVIFGSDQGLCGQLNAVIALTAMDRMKELGVKKEDRLVLTVGLRAADYILDAGQPIEECLTTPGSTSGITPMVQEIMIIMDEWHSKRQIDYFYLYYNQYVSGATYRPHSIQLLPINREWLKSLEKQKWDSRSLPFFTMDWEALFSSLIREYLFVSLYRAFAESLASENASRLAAMQNAEKNIGERLDELKRLFYRQRQMTITEELLDVLAGFEAMSVQRRPAKASQQTPPERG
ncbi:MAG: synthase gamma subunit-like protein [Bacteroidetes bacterium]|nr:synthase gamma subunit-like protein [Bacteroidota bacterium]